MSQELKTIILDALTGEVVERLFTPEETEEYQSSQATEEASKAEQDAKAAARQSALAKLAALGLTEEEIAAL